MSDGRKLHLLDLVAYTRSMAVMINAGVSLVRDLSILEEMFDEPLRSATRVLSDEVCAGSTLSAAMTKRPDVFTRLCAQIVKVGEVGGVLDETCQQVADLLEADWAAACGVGEGRRGLLVPCERPEPSFADAAADDRLRLLSLYFRSLGTMLTAGVPLEAAVLWQTAASILPPGAEQEALAAVANKVRDRGRLHYEYFQLLFVPAIALQLISIGIETNTFSLMCEKIAQLLEYQRRHYLLKQRERAT